MPDSPVLFLCPRHLGSLRLSAHACGESWAKHQVAPKRGDLVHPCWDCPIGAGHAGAAQDDRPPVATERDCALCGRGHLRLVRDGVLCISCYNRLREVAQGHTRRGSLPGITLTMFEVIDDEGPSAESGSRDASG